MTLLLERSVLELLAGSLRGALIGPTDPDYEAALGRELIGPWCARHVHLGLRR